jgi:cell division protease FtsH
MARRFSTDWLEDHRVHFSEPIGKDAIVGIGHVLTEVDSVLGRLQHPELVIAMGGELPRGILLYGQPGLGKTLVARYMASNLGPDVPMYELSADELTPPKVRGLFRHLASDGARSVVYLDEIDVVAMNRGWDSHAPSTRAILVALLAALDGLRPTAGPVLIASSNRSPHYLDPALMRQGRIGFHVQFPIPDKDDRVALLKLFLKPRPVATDIDLPQLAALSRGMSPAGLRQAVDDATGLALADGRRVIEQVDLIKAVRRDGQIEGDEGHIDPTRLDRMAVHEAGHVAVAVALRGPTWVTRVQIGQFDGDTAVGEEGRPTGAIPADELWDAVTLAFGGIEAENVVLGSMSLGAASDLGKVTSLVHQMAQHGLMPGLAGLDLASLGIHPGATVPDMLAMPVPPTLAEARERAAQIVRTNAQAIRSFADALVAAGGSLVEEPLAQAIASAGFRPRT